MSFDLIACDLVHSVNVHPFITLETTVATDFPNDLACSPKELRITLHGIMVQP